MAKRLKDVGMPPCGECGDRHEACHSSCDTYKDWRREQAWAKKMTAIQRARDATTARCGCVDSWGYAKKKEFANETATMRRHKKELANEG